MQNIDNIRETLKVEFKKARDSRRWSQAELAKRCQTAGLPFYASTIGKIETGKRSLDAAEAIALADVLGMDLRTVISETSSIDRLLSAETDALISAESNLSHAVELFFESYDSLETVIREARSNGVSSEESTTMRDAVNRLRYAELSEVTALNEFSRVAYDFDYVEDAPVGDTWDMGSDDGTR